MVKTAKSELSKETLKLRRLGIDTYRENVAYLHRDCEVYRAEGFQALSKVKICADGRRILAVLNVVDDDKIVTKLSMIGFKCSDGAGNRDITWLTARAIHKAGEI